LAANESQPPACVPATLFRRWQLRLLSIGPGAIIASLTIGTGELIFSARAGVLFGYSILWVFLLLLALKGVMVYTLARHLVLTGVHPLARWMELPGPRGWLPMSLLLSAALLFPIWVGFHSGVIGTLLSQTVGVPIGAGSLAILLGTLWIVFRGGYATLERLQLGIVGGMVIGVLASLLLLRPSLLDILGGALIPSWPAYPNWLAQAPELASIARRPIWAELGTYVGVIGGSSFDYLAYAAFLRQKGWGNAGGTRRPVDDAKKDLSLVRTDLLVSFLAVMLISTAFVASGHLVLGPARQIPNDDNMLNLQATFLTRLHPSLYPLYVAGAFLTMVGTLYGTIEVAPAVLREWMIAYRGSDQDFRRRLCVAWVGLGGVLVVSARLGSMGRGQSQWSLVDLVTPAAIVTGVLLCGVICWANIWAECRFMSRRDRLPRLLLGINAFAGLVFLSVGGRALLESKSVGSRPWLPLILVFGVGLLAACCFPPVRPDGSRPASDTT
jgi:hypothetical protein